MSTALERLNSRQNVNENKLSRQEKRKARRNAKKGKTYKERNGTTRVGDFLRGLKNAAPELVEAAGKITGIPGLQALGELISGDAQLTDFEKQIALKELEMDMIEMQELTKRLQSDNEHLITRLVRPVSYAFVLLNLGILMYFDGNVGEFTIDKEWLPTIKSLALTMTGFYFGSRGIEKVIKTMNG